MGRDGEGMKSVWSAAHLCGKRRASSGQTYHYPAATSGRALYLPKLHFPCHKTLIIMVPTGGIINGEDKIGTENVSVKHMAQSLVCGQH